MKTDWRELEGVKPRWDNQVHLLDELLANVNNFNLSHEVEGIIHFFLSRPAWPALLLTFSD